jgi:integrase
LDPGPSRESRASRERSACKCAHAAQSAQARVSVVSYFDLKTGSWLIRGIISDAQDRTELGRLRDPDAPARRLGPTTLRRIHACLSSALTRAVKARKIGFNPAQHVDLPDASRPRVVPWEPVELGRFLDYAVPHRFGIIYELVAATGLRRGEALGLRWVDLDAVAGALVINQQLVDSGNGAPTFGPPKTAASEHRRVELDKRTVGALLVHRLAQDEERRRWGTGYEDHGLVFAQENGRPYDPAKITKTFTTLARDAGVRPVRLHDLRHGAASLMLTAGIPVEVVSKRLGHSSIGITLDTYSHLLEGVGRHAAEAAATLVPRSAPPTSPTTHSDHNVTITKADEAASPSTDVVKWRLTSTSVSAPRGNRTPNPLIKSQLLCLLS